MSAGSRRRRAVVVTAVVLFVLACAAILVVRQGTDIVGSIANARRTGGATLAPYPTKDPDAETPAPSYLSLSPTAPSTGTASPTVPAGWELIDHDDFSSSLSAKRWGVYDSVSSNRVSRWLPSQVKVRNGVLTITGIGRDQTGRTNKAGGLCWCFGVGNQLYGRWEVRTRIDPGVGYGGAILLWPKSDKWPDDGEVDFGETPNGQRTSISTTVHWAEYGENNNDSSAVHGDFTQWHVLAVEWLPGSVIMSADGIPFYDSRTSPNKPKVPDVPMHLALQLEPGPYGSNWIKPPDATTPDQVRLQFDWVRLYRPAP